MRETETNAEDQVVANNFVDELKASSPGLPSYRFDFAPGNILLAQDAPAEDVFVVQFGEVELLLKVGKEEIPVETAGQGKILGLTGVFSGRASPVTARARTNVAAIVIPASELLRALSNNPGLYLSVAPFLTDTLTGAYEHIRVLKTVGRSPRAARLA